MSSKFNRSNLDGFGEYKPVEQGFVSEIPSHWEIRPIKRLFDVQVGKMLQNNKESSSEVKVPYLKARHIRKNGNIENQDLPEMWFSPEEVKKYTLKRGDVIVAEGGDVGRSAIWQGEEKMVGYQNSINRLRPLHGNSSRFLYYWLSFLKNQGYIDMLCDSATISHYTAETVEETPLIVPPQNEQDSIDQFLTREISKIDHLIRRKRQIVELLEDRRESFIHEVVSRHSNGDQVELKYISELLPGYAFPSDNFVSEDGVKLLRGINVGVGEIKWEDVEMWPSEKVEQYEKYLLEPHDLILGMDRPWIGSGLRLAKMSKTDCPALLVQRVLRIRSGPETSQEYLRLVLEHSRFRQYFQPITTGVSVPHISRKQVGNFEIPLPEKEKQEQIIDVWNEFRQGYNRLERLSNQSINLLQEKRQALITAAVTGQIDVSDARGLAQEHD